MPPTDSVFVGLGDVSLSSTQPQPIASLIWLSRSFTTAVLMKSLPCHLLSPSYKGWCLIDKSNRASISDTKSSIFPVITFFYFSIFIKYLNVMP
ncbi:hypothetical protein F2Q70_00009066 [Brassica cretica]|uniref:Uncharacterized protein n=1 Tax=Brassica cretica TaxID=69181 RepID=A0A8S9JMY8_BRACR|nr:hypothetical protein F2Q68_00002152 [Brassica cretica]KAF2611905.1 hypothetical protein F2Q70_00009066 [Brassica cretica]